MQPTTTILVTDGRWPLDADGLSVVREVELRGPVALQRAPDGLDAFRFTSGARQIIIGGPAPAPPSGWVGTACWHEATGCESIFIDSTVSPSGSTSVSAFLEATAPADSSVPWMAKTAGVLVFAGLLVLIRRWIRVQHRRARGTTHVLPMRGME